jgi:hypothetical protein
LTQLAHVQFVDIPESHFDVIEHYFWEDEIIWDPDNKTKKPELEDFDAEKPLITDLRPGIVLRGSTEDLPQEQILKFRSRKVGSKFPRYVPRPFTFFPPKNEILEKGTYFFITFRYNL